MTTHETDGSAGSEIDLGDRINKTLGVLFKRLDEEGDKLSLVELAQVTGYLVKIDESRQRQRSLDQAMTLMASMAAGFSQATQPRATQDEPS